MPGKFALITGASSGIGFELAQIAADDGYDLLLAADTPLAAAVADLAESGVAVETVEGDLATFEGVDRLLEATNGRDIDVLCANAGHGLGGPFLDQAPDDWRHVIDTNISGTVYLVQKVLRAMRQRGEGKVLVTGSIAGFIPGSLNAVYNGSKAFVDNWTEALRNEMQDAEGLTLTTLLPGPTETEFFDRAGLGETKTGASDKADAQKVARDGWDAMMKGDGRIVSGVMNKLQVAASGVLPQSALAESHRKQMEPSE